MKNFNFDEFINKVNIVIIEHHYIRFGQSCFNIMIDQYPEVYEKFKEAGVADPFYFNYGDPPVMKFLEWLGEYANNNIKA